MEKAYADSGIQGAILVCTEHLVSLSLSEHLDSISVSQYFALVGDTEQTFVWLEKAYEERAPAIHLLAQPALDPYRSDPRFLDLMGRIGISESGWEGLGSGGD